MMVKSLGDPYFPSTFTAFRVAACCILLLGLAAITSLSAQQVSHERDLVDLRLGQRALVDDGTCPAGQVEEVLGATMTSNGISRAPSRATWRHVGSPPRSIPPSECTNYFVNAGHASVKP
jgi:hypothetical protein